MLAKSALEPTQRSPGHSIKQTRERRLDDGGELLKPLAGGPATGPIEPEPVLGEILSWLSSSLMQREWRLVDLPVIEEGLA